MTNLRPILDEFEQEQSLLLPILHAVQAQDGFISEDAMRAIAAYLNLTRAEVFGVVSFYHDFRRSPQEVPVLKICRSEACKARGIETLMPAATEQAGSALKLEPIYCLGVCAVGPAAMTADGNVVARLDQGKLQTLIEDCS